MENKLLELLKRLAPTKNLLLSMDRLEMIILTVGLELIRQAFNLHMRGVILNSADRLDHMLNMCKAAIRKDVLNDYSEFAEVKKSRVTVWNDSEVKKEEFLRSHMIHHEVVMNIGFGLNVHQKRSWNGLDLEGLKITEKEMKKRLRVVIFNDDLEIKFENPIFDPETGTYNLNEMTTYDDALDRPLLPLTKGNFKGTMIR